MSGRKAMEPIDLSSTLNRLLQHVRPCISQSMLLQGLHRLKSVYTWLMLMVNHLKMWIEAWKRLMLTSSHLKVRIKVSAASLYIYIYGYAHLIRFSAASVVLLILSCTIITASDNPC
jgi:hypothetical protein